MSNERAETLEEFFGSPISAYTDRQAVLDGVLVDTSGLMRARNRKAVNRVTRAVWDAFVDFMGRSRVTGPVSNITKLLAAMEAAVAGDEQNGWYFAEYEGRTLWLVPNETGGMTLMFPEDY